MIRTTVQVHNEMGLHARAAVRLVRLASALQAQVRIARSESDQGIDARSILGLLLLAAGKGTVLTVTVEGEDEAAAAQAIVELFRTGFGE